MGTQAHMLLALPVPLCSSCCSLLKCIYCTAYGKMKCLSAGSSGLSAILNRSLGCLRSAAPFLCSFLSPLQFPLRFGQGLAPALWNSFSFKWSWWGVKKTKGGGSRRGLSSSLGCARLSEQTLRRACWLKYLLGHLLCTWKETTKRCVCHPTCRGAGCSPGVPAASPSIPLVPLLCWYVGSMEAWPC